MTTALIVALLFSFTAPATAQLVNGSFETGDYSGWTLLEMPPAAGGTILPFTGIFGMGTAGQVIDSTSTVTDLLDVGTTLPLFFIPPTASLSLSPIDGGFAAFHVQSGSIAARMYQDVTLGADASQLRWRMQYDNQSPGGFVSGFQGVHVSLRDPTTDLLLATLFETQAGTSPLSIPMQQFSADISAYAGMSVRINVDIDAQDNVLPFLLFAADDFRINRSPTPSCPANVEVAAASPAGTMVTLDASASMDPDGDPFTFAWTSSPTAVAFDDPSIAAPTALFPVGTTTATLTLTDTHGAVSTCTVDVTVVPSNLPPVADSAVEQLTDVGSLAVLRLDGSASFDPDDATSTLNYRWTVDSIVVCDGDEATCAVVEVPLTFGTHDVVLRVTDPAGLFDEITRSVTLDPAALSVLSVEDAEVDFGRSPPRLRLRGEIGLPAGTNFTAVTPTAALDIVLGGAGVLPTTGVNFQVSGAFGQHWDFRDLGATTGIRRFHIDWRGARYRFRQAGFPVRLRTRLIGDTETLLEVRLRRNQITGPFSLDIGGQALVDFDGNGDVTSSSVAFEVSLGGRRVLLTLPFPLLATTQIDFTGSLSQSLTVGDNLRTSVGRFRLNMRYDAALLPLAELTVPRTLDMFLSIGGQGYAGNVSLDATDLTVDGDTWIK